MNSLGEIAGWLVVLLVAPAAIAFLYAAAIGRYERRLLRRTEPASSAPAHSVATLASERAAWRQQAAAHATWGRPTTEARAGTVTAASAASAIQPPAVLTMSRHADAGQRGLLLKFLVEHVGISMN